MRPPGCAGASRPGRDHVPSGRGWTCVYRNTTRHNVKPVQGSGGGGGQQACICPVPCSWSRELTTSPIRLTFDNFLCMHSFYISHVPGMLRSTMRGTRPPCRPCTWTMQRGAVTMPMVTTRRACLGLPWPAWTSARISNVWVEPTRPSPVPLRLESRTQGSPP